MLSPKSWHSLAGKPWPKHLTSLSFIILSFIKWIFFPSNSQETTFYRCTCLNASQKHSLCSVMNMKAPVTLKLHCTISYFCADWTTTKSLFSPLFSRHYRAVSFFSLFLLSPSLPPSFHPSLSLSSSFFFPLSHSFFWYSDIAICGIQGLSERNKKEKKKTLCAIY